MCAIKKATGMEQLDQEAVAAKQSIQLFVRRMDNQSEEPTTATARNSLHAASCKGILTKEQERITVCVASQQLRQERRKNGRKHQGKEQEEQYVAKNQAIQPRKEEKR